MALIQGKEDNGAQVAADGRSRLRPWSLFASLVPSTRAMDLQSGARC